MKQLFIVTLVALFILGCTAQQGAVSTQAKNNAAGNSINIKDFSYQPSEITIKKGTTVTWTNLDSVKHTVTSDSGLFDSGLLSNQQTWSHTFNDVGTFSYYCTVHPSMKGKIIVE